MFEGKSLVRWKETQYRSTTVRKRLNRKDLAKDFAILAGKYMAGGFVFALIFYAFISYRRGFAFNEGDIILFAVFMLIGLVFAFVAWMTAFRNLFNPPEIIFFPKGIRVRHFLGDEAETTYQEIQYYRISTAEIDATKFRVLEIKNWKGNEFTFEIDENIKSADIIEIFKSKNVQMRAVER